MTQATRWLAAALAAGALAGCSSSAKPDSARSATAHAPASTIGKQPKSDTGGLRRPPPP
jgi:outer membrane murein-binding lipoprotein Lpp